MHVGPQLRRLSTPVAALILGASACAQTITYTDLLPPGASNGAIYAISANQQAGVIYSVSGKGPLNSYATIWSNSAASGTNIGVLTSYAYGTTGTRQAGGDIFDVGQNLTHALFWSNSAASVTDLNPSGASQSYAYANSANQQAGYAIFSLNFTHAGIWSGSSSSFVDLNPPGASDSVAYGTDGTHQCGYFQVSPNPALIACMWSSTAASYVDLNPSWSMNSYCYAIAKGQQVGVANTNGHYHAAIWSGSAASIQDLHPANGAASSALNATTGSQQAGYLGIDASGNTNHAALWYGTAKSVVDLHAYLPASFINSVAQAIWTGGNVVKVGGFADSTNGIRHPILWTIAFPAPSATSPRVVGTNFLCSLNGLLAGQTVVTETSTNLAAWTPVQTNTSAASPLSITNFYSISMPAKFFRFLIR